MRRHFRVKTAHQRIASTVWLGVGIPWEEEVLGDEIWKVEAGFEEFGLYVVYSTYLLLL